MKKLFTLLLVTIFGIFTYAQDKIYVHTATAANISSVGYIHVTYIDHPDLNGNPNAAIVYKHAWNPNGVDVTNGVDNNHIDGLWYSNTRNQWAIYNEDSSPMVEGAKFFIYIASDPSTVFTHIASVANQHSSSGAAFSVINEPGFEINPGPFAVMSNYFNPNSVYNPYNYGFLFDDVFLNKRTIFSEDLGPIPTDAAFKILKGGTGVITRFTAESNASNLSNSGDSFSIDNPFLNNNPNATFVFQHYSGVNGASTEVEINKVLTAWYFNDVGMWYIGTEDYSPMPEGVAVDIIVANQEVLGVQDATITKVTLFPNPAKNAISITSYNAIDKVIVYNVLGQEVLKTTGKGTTSLQVDITSLDFGNYIVKVQTGDVTQNLKLIKN